MPNGVPPMIANTFTALIPAILVGLFFIAVATIFSFTPYGSFTQLVYTVIVTPLNSLGGSVWSLVVLILVQMLLWFFGIHGSNVISGVITAVYLPMATANLEAYAAGKALDQEEYTWYVDPVTVYLRNTHAARRAYQDGSLPL